MRRSPSPLLSLSKLSTLILSILIFATLSFAATPDRISGPIVHQQLVRLSAGVPLQAQPQYDQGEVDLSLKLGYMTLLTVPSASQQKAIDRLLAQQQDRRSPLFHKWLTPEQYADRFGLSPNDIQKITAWLQSQGFEIVRVARARNFIVFSGTAAQAETSFQTQIHNFEIGGEKHFANITPISIPTALSSVVTGVRGLSNFRAKSYLKHKNPNFTYPIPGTNPQAYQPFLAPGDIATMYGIPANMTGAGQKLAVLGQTDVFLADLNDFRSNFGLTSIPISGAGSCTTDLSGLIIPPCTTTTPGASFQYVLVNADPGTPTSSDDLAESDLDLEWSHATAQDAQIVFVNAPERSGDGVWDSWYYAVDNNVAPVITMSYGICELGEAENPGGQGTINPNEGTFTADEAELKKANSLGITFMNSSGDSGAAGCDGNPPVPNPPNPPNPPYLAAQFGQAVNYPASSPEVTGVGGTAVTIADVSTNFNTYWSTANGPTGGSVLKYIPEAPWNDDAEIGAYCAATPKDTVNCDPTGTGQVKITNQWTFQEDFWLSSTGGGPSNCYTISGQVCAGGFPQPDWQQGLSIPGQTTAVRFVPDVSLLASPNFPGYIVCSDFSCDIIGCGVAGGVAAGCFDQVGGTSASAPIFAGIVAMLNQYVVANGIPTPLPGRLGNINPILYQIATYNQAASAFHAVTASDYTANPGSNQVYCQPKTPSGQPNALVCPAAVSPATEGIIGYLSSSADATTGYNLVTGLGSVNVANLATALGDTFVATTTTISTATPTAFEGQSVTFNVSVASPSKPDTATGAATFYNNGQVFGSTTREVTGGAATFTTSQLPVGTDSVTAAYNGIYATSTSATPAVVTVIAPNFTLTPTTATITTTQGGTAGPDTITVKSDNGFVTGSQTAVPLSYSCAGLPSESSCSFNPTSPTSSATVAVSIKTTAPTAQLRMPLGRGNQIFYAMLLPGLFGIVLTLGSRKRGARGVRLLSFIVVLGVSTMWLAACGGGGGGGVKDPGTPTGSYTITINAAAGTVQGTAGTVTLTVN